MIFAEVCLLNFTETNLEKHGWYLFELGYFLKHLRYFKYFSNFILRKNYWQLNFHGWLKYTSIKSTSLPQKVYSKELLSSLLKLGMCWAHTWLSLQQAALADKLGATLKHHRAEIQVLISKVHLLYRAFL